MYEQMVNYVSRNGLISSFQSGFRPARQLLLQESPIIYGVQRYSFRARAMALVSSYLFPWYQKVACGDHVCHPALLVAGVTQGSPILLLCFSLFIDDMTKALEFSKYHMYANDLQIYHSRPREMLFECIREVNSDLSRVFE
jgi:hypothetical protein